ncbi:MAG: L,D-transpeptidase family protein [Hyphomonadaceae bacterium]
MVCSGAFAAGAVAQPLDEVAAGQGVSENVIDIAGWVLATDNNRGLPFAVVDKNAAQILIFDAEGKLKGLAPALLGSAVGDGSAPGVGDRELKDIPAEDRTTPAGRFLVGYGPATGGKTVLWVDYATAISIHPLPQKSPKKEKRKERLASATAEDNRITHGCINVSTAFYNKVVKSTFGKQGGVFYVLPDSMPMEYAFPGF